jgi:hypothetical protein
VITAEAKASFLAGDQWAYLAGIVAVLLGAVLVFFFFPKHAEEEALLARFAAEDAESETKPAGSQVAGPVRQRYSPLER